MSTKILLLIGSGANIGAATVKTFLAAGYKVAQGARSLKPEDSSEDVLKITVDITQPETVSKAFEETRKKFGEPNVVIFNAAAYHNGGANDTLNHPSFADFTSDLTANVTSPFVAARESLASFENLPSSGSSSPSTKAFIFTGNILNEQVPIPGLLTLGIGKSATAYMIAEADAVYSQKENGGVRFYFVDQRTEEGKPAMGALSGKGHADFFLELVEGKDAKKVPWQATFVSGVGYKEFPVGSLKL